ncbi:MAG TPA: hypothetical protein IAA52_07890 [Candidatus Pullichristensenella stercorigallinarum]|uniref:Uncharacterized protein n=1 Tax=Candidatus Pullichristensenella stercorigallinarum TaxID=2840909 RepID=A0A9D0ZM21_9FIRM|nr:hypothetical protein [Candidatus Pullichristensenella stercorigallinarum]
MLDTLHACLNTDYLSDLRYDRNVRRVLPFALGVLPDARFSVREWNRALGYLYGDGGLRFATVAAAKQYVQTHPMPEILP